MNVKERAELFRNIQMNEKKYTSSEKKSISVLKITIKIISTIVILAVAAFTLIGIITIADAALRTQFVNVVKSLF